MDLRNLVTFIHVSELKSFTKAAEVLGYAQSTVSSQIKQLEQELNVQLLERINHTVTLTSRGKEVLNYAHQIQNLTKALSTSMEDEKAVKGHVRLATADSMCKELFGEAYLKFKKDYPDITMKFITAGTDEMMRLLNHNEVDLIYTVDSHVYSTEYVIVKEEKVEVHFVADKGHPLADRNNLSIRDLLNEPFILTEKGMSYRRIFDEKLAAMSLAVEPMLEMGNTDQICWLVEQGIGITLLPDYTTKEAVKEGRLVYLDVKDIKIDIWKQLLYHRDKWISPELGIVLTTLRNL